MSGAPGVSMATSILQSYSFVMVPHEGINLRNWFSFLVIAFREIYSVQCIFAQNIEQYGRMAVQIGKHSISIFLNKMGAWDSIFRGVPRKLKKVTAQLYKVNVCCDIKQ